MKEETTKQDTDLGIISDLELVGDRVIIKLDQAEDHTRTESGLLIPLNQNVEKESGRVGSRLSKRKHLATGTVLALSDYASNKIAEYGAEIKPGDKVYVTEMSANNVSTFQFFPDRRKLVQDFQGYIIIPHTQIEAKVKNGN